MNHNVRPVLERLAKIRSRKGVIHEERYLMFVSQLSKLGKIQDMHGRIGNGFSKNGFGIWADGLFQLFQWRKLIHEGHIDPHFFERMGK